MLTPSLCLQVEQRNLVHSPHHQLSSPKSLMQHPLLPPGLPPYDHLHRPRREDCFRVRSTSLGSAASSSRSPGRESVASVDSQPALASCSSSSCSSPSPSPPSPPQEASTLFNLLKGNLTSPYARLFASTRNSPSPSRCRCGCSPKPSATTTLSPAPHAAAAAGVKRSHSECGLVLQDEPMDLSCKRPRTQSTPAGGASDSMLEAILRGRSHSDWAPFSPRPPSALSMAPPASPAGSESSVTSGIGASSRVSLAKKNLLPVRARVSDWLGKIASFCRSQPTFQSLNHSDQVALLQGAWPRLLLLYMAETHFEFVVSACSAVDDDEDSVSQQPTMHDVEKVQAFIRRCQALGLDAEEFRLLRAGTLLQHSTGLSQTEAVETASSAIRQAMQDHADSTRPQEKMRRYSSLLLCLHAMCGVNGRAMEALFCSHVPKAEGCLGQMLLDEYP